MPSRYLTAADAVLDGSQLKPNADSGSSAGSIGASLKPLAQITPPMQRKDN